MVAQLYEALGDDWLHLNVTFITVGSSSEGCGGSAGEKTEGRCCSKLPQHNGTSGHFSHKFLHTSYLKFTLFLFVLCFLSLFCGRSWAKYSNRQRFVFTRKENQGKVQRG